MVEEPCYITVRRAALCRTALVSFTDKKSASRANKPNEFMPVGITKISEISAIRTDARWVLD